MTDEDGTATRTTTQGRCSKRQRSATLSRASLSSTAKDGAAFVIAGANVQPLPLRRAASSPALEPSSPGTIQQFIHCAGKFQHQRLQYLCDAAANQHLVCRGMPGGATAGLGNGPLQPVPRQTSRSLPVAALPAAEQPATRRSSTGNAEAGLHMWHRDLVLACWAADDDIRSSAQAFEIELITELGRQLRVAASRLRLDIVTALIHAGADVRSRDAAGRTAVHEVAQADVPDAAAATAAERLLDLLLRRGADLWARDAAGATPLHLAAGRPAMAVLVVAAARHAGSDPLRLRLAEAALRAACHCGAQFPAASAAELQLLQGRFRSSPAVTARSEADAAQTVAPGAGTTPATLAHTADAHAAAALTTAAAAAVAAARLPLREPGSAPSLRAAAAAALLIPQGGTLS